MKKACLERCEKREKGKNRHPRENTIFSKVKLNKQRNVETARYIHVQGKV